MRKINIFVINQQLLANVDCLNRVYFPEQVDDMRFSQNIHAFLFVIISEYLTFHPADILSSDVLASDTTKEVFRYLQTKKGT